MLMKESVSSPIHLRLRFSIELNEEAEQVIQKFKNVLQNGNDKFPSRFVDGHIIIDVPKKEDHFWSPQLNIEVENTGKNKTLLKGLFGPKPQVWTLFMFIHTVVGIAFLVFSVILYVKWRLDESIILPLIMTLFLPLFWVLLYFLGRIGKSTGHTQMDDLHHLMTNILKN
jgi:hypothetical protein